MCNSERQTGRPASVFQFVPKFFDLGEEFRGGRRVFIAAFGVEFFEQIFLFARQFNRCFDHGLNIEVALAATSQSGHALAAQAELFA